MTQAKLAEIFLSYQGEGPFAGSRALFIRFFGCNLDCKYCDTPLDSYEIISSDMLLEKVSSFGDDYNELVLTGGEPLLHADFLTNFLPIFKEHHSEKVYLETNGTLAREFKKIRSWVDIVACDFKLPSSMGYDGALWEAHKEFLKCIRGKEIIIKVIITGSTQINDIERMSRIIKGVEEDITIVLQPVTPISCKIEVPSEEMLYQFRECIRRIANKEVSILGQIHRYLEIR